MMYLTTIAILGVLLSAEESHQQNATLSSTRRTSHRDTNIFAALQQLQLQMGALEAESQRQTSRIQELHRIVTRLEVQKQDLLSTLDRSEGRLSQRLDDIKGDIRKVITLQEVIRDDVDKVQENQLLSKVWLEEHLRQLGSRSIPDGASIHKDSITSLTATTDVLSNIQMVQSALNSLRRMADALQNSINIVKANVTQLTNITRQISHQQQNVLVTKTYLQSTLQSYQTDPNEYQQFLGCPSAIHELKEYVPKDCKEIQEKVENKTGVYRMQPNYATRPIFVYCDMETEGGGWTVIQRRRDGSVDFLREWNDYKHGFGNVAGEFWLGNENLHLITHQGLYELRVDLYDFEDGHASAKYAGFAVGSEKERYMLKLLGSFVSGDAGDGLTYHASLPFSTIDMDNDLWAGGSCAQDHTGGWWYNQCDASNLNGQYLRGLTQMEYKGVYWHEWQGPNYSLMATQMMIRPVTYNGGITTREPEKETVSNNNVTATVLDVNETETDI